MEVNILCVAVPPISDSYPKACKVQLLIALLMHGSL